MVVGGIIGIIVGALFVLAGIFKWGPLVVSNANGDTGVVSQSSSGYTVLMIIIGAVCIISGIGALIHH